MAENYINKIKIGTNEYDIQASSIGNVSEVNFVSGTKNGKVRINDKGNVSVESLSKNVNLEAEKNIQLKAKEDIIFDSKRRIQGGGGNEVHLKFEYDDWEQGSSNNLDDEKWAELKVEARNMDLRCKDHGGLALQPCGIDGNGNENKIKFESSRKVDANTEIPDDLRRTSSNYSDYYLNEGGKGVEFGTFNNEHTSIYTKDYRFNGDGKVYSVTRGTISNDSGKYDYPTQGDDFKDIPVDDAGIQGTYNSTSGKWEKSSSSDGKYLVESSWNSIIKTAHALNDQSWTNTNISGKGNLQITASDEIEWVEAENNGAVIELKNDKNKREYADDGNVYRNKNGQLGGFDYATSHLVAEHHLNIEADSTIKIESGFNDVELIAGDKIQNTAPIIQLEAKNVVNEGTPEEENLVDYGIVDFSTTPNIQFMSRKINKYGGYESSNAILKITSLNNLGKTVYENVNEGYVRIPYDTLYYKNSSDEYVPYNPTELITDSKVKVYTNQTGDVPEDGNYFFELDNMSIMISVSAGEAGKKAKICKYKIEDIYTDENQENRFDINTSETIALYDSDGNLVGGGYHIIESNNIKYIIKTDDNGELIQFSVNNNGGTSGKELVPGWNLPLNDRISKYDYEDIIFGGSQETGEEAVETGQELTVGNMECELKDIITLVNFFKNGDGQNMGPWSINNDHQQGGGK